MLIITHRKEFHLDGCLVVDSLESAIKLAHDKHETELFIIGGGEIFSQSINLADKLYLTRVHTKVGADVFFPTIDQYEWRLLHREEFLASDKDEFDSNFKILIRNHA